MGEKEDADVDSGVADGKDPALAAVPVLDLAEGDLVAAVDEGRDQKEKPRPLRREKRGC
jgi:hypothetical protein